MIPRSNLQGTCSLLCMALPMTGLLCALRAGPFTVRDLSAGRRHKAEEQSRWSRLGYRHVVLTTGVLTLCPKWGDYYLAPTNCGQAETGLMLASSDFFM